MPRLNRKRLDEAILGLPSSLNPYAPSTRQDVDMANPSKPAGPEDIPQPGEAASTEQPITPADEGGGQPGAEQGGSLGGGGDSYGQVGSADPTQPEMPTWEKEPLPNKKDIGFRRTDGFFLRLRRVDSVAGRYLAQLWKKDEILDKGFVDVPQGDNPIQFIQTMANTMLDDESERMEQETPTTPGEETGQPPEEEQPGGGVGTGGGGGGAGGLGSGGTGGLGNIDEEPLPGGEPGAGGAPGNDPNGAPPDGQGVEGDQIPIGSEEPDMPQGGGVETGQPGPEGAEGGAGEGAEGSFVDDEEDFDFDEITPKDMDKVRKFGQPGV